MGHDDAVYGDSTLWGGCHKSIVSIARIAITFMTRPYKNSPTSCFQKEGGNHRKEQEDRGQSGDPLI